MKQCGYCGCDIIGEVFDSVDIGPITIGCSDGSEYKAGGVVSLGFCCEGCAWAFEFESHCRWYGMCRKVAKRHLSDVHRLRAGKTGGKMCKECSEMLGGMAEMWGILRSYGSGMEFSDN